MSSDSSGRFTVSRLRPGAYILTANLSDQVVAAEASQLSVSPSSSYAPAARKSGVVVWPPGADDGKRDPVILSSGDAIDVGPLMLFDQPRHFLSAGLVPLALMIIIQPQQARALSITATECSIQAFFCPIGSIVGTGTQTDFVNLLGATAAAGFNFNFNNADVNFTGRVLATNNAGLFQFIDGIGVATTNQANAAPFWLNVDINESYVTNPAIVGLVGVVTEFNVGTCNAQATAAGSFVQAQIVADGTILPVLGGPGMCAGAGVFNLAGFGLVGITQPVVFDAIAQFQFNPGAAGQAIDRPFGESNAPEPGSFALFGAGLLFSGISMFDRDFFVRYKPN